MHEQYKIKKARYAKASETITSPSDVPESSYGGRKKNKMNKMVQWIKALFGKCTYAAERAYHPPLPPSPPPPHYDLPSLLDSKDEDEDEIEEDFDYQTTLGSTLRSMATLATL